MEKIAMKCTREQYESIKELVGELDNKSTFDFNQYKYLKNYADGNCTMFTSEVIYQPRKIYETFDRAIFLKACGIKVKKDKRKKMFKKTIKLLKSFDELNFDINTINSEYGYDIDQDGNKFLDGTFEITITGNKHK
jgi:hypothetical protein